MESELTKHVKNNISKVNNEIVCNLELTRNQMLTVYCSIIIYKVIVERNRQAIAMYGGSPDKVKSFDNDIGELELILKALEKSLYGKWHDEEE